MLPYLARTLHLPLTVTYVVLIAALILVALAAGVIVRRILRGWARRLHLGWERLTVEALESLAIPLLVVGTLDLGIELLELPRRYARVLHILVFAVILGMVFGFLGRLVGLVFRYLFKDDAAFARMTQPATLFVRAVLGFLALIIFLENIGVSLTAVWTTLGVGSVAIGLALQATLSNFFAGITLLADRPISPGDHILLGPGGPGLEGEVLRIGWRATEVQTLSKETAFVPNSVMASTILTNYSLSGVAAVVSIPVKLHGTSDIDDAEALLIKTAQQITVQLHLPTEPPPQIEITSEFTDPFLQLLLKVPVARLADREKVAQGLRKEITALYHQGELKGP